MDHMRIATLFMTIFLLACNTEANSPPLSEAEPNRQYRVASGPLQQFFIGQKVQTEIRQTGSFTPDLEDWYTRIDVPLELVEKVTAENPLTFSICSPLYGAAIYDHAFVGPEKAIANRPEPPDPFITTTDEGELIQSYRSGDPFVYGTIQVSVKDGLLLAGAAASVYVEFTEGPATARSGGFLFGRITEDPVPEDPDIESCVSPGPGF
jgi:hypothetical protein